MIETIFFLWVVCNKNTLRLKGSKLNFLKKGDKARAKANTNKIIAPEPEP